MIVNGERISAIEVLYPRSLRYLADYLQSLVRGRLWLQVMVGMVLGIATGIVMGPTVGWLDPAIAATASDWLAFPGKLFLALIQMIVIPLVFASIIRGLAATEDLEQLRRIGLRAVLYFIATTALAIVIGLAVASVIKPGTYIDSQNLQTSLGALPTAVETNAASGIELKELPQKIITLLPANPLNSMVESNMLQVVIFAMMVGIALVMMVPAQAKPMLDLLGSLQEVCMTVVRWAMWLAPIAVFGLLAQLTAKLGLNALLGMAAYVGTVLLGLLGSLQEVCMTVVRWAMWLAPIAVFGLLAQLTAKLGLNALLGMAAYVGTVLLGLLLMFCVYLLVIFVVARLSPWKFIAAVRDVLLLAFSTSSSAAVMPLSIKTVEEKLGVRPSVSQFIIPLGATINMNGTALYQGVAALFLAQIFGIDIGLGGMALIVLTSVGASIGAPATPGVGIVILSMVLGTVGIPAAGIALIMGVDRILDMSRTAVNVAGDLVAARLMDQWVGGKGSSDQALREEAAREQLRARSGEDVITEER